MCFKVNLKMKKPTLSFCFKWILFIELDFTVAKKESLKNNIQRGNGLKVEGGAWPVCRFKRGHCEKEGVVFLRELIGQWAL